MGNDQTFQMDHLTDVVSGDIEDADAGHEC